MMNHHRDRLRGRWGAVAFAAQLFRYFTRSWRLLQRDASLWPGGPNGDRAAFDPRPMIVLTVAAVCLALIFWLSGYETFDRWFDWPRDHPYYHLAQGAFWVGLRVIGYVLLPIATLWALGEPVSQYGLSIRGIGRHAWIYVGMMALMVPVIAAMSSTAAFQAEYPFYKQATRSWFDLLAWEGLYAVQFASLEFFYRGFLLFSLRPRLGAYAIFVMMVPYCMIHFGKPIAETLAAIPAGIILGTLALRTGSIWMGALLHTAVAWTMDLFSLAQTGAWQELFRH